MQFGLCLTITTFGYIQTNLAIDMFEQILNCCSPGMVN